MIGTHCLESSPLPCRWSSNHANPCNIRGYPGRECQGSFPNLLRSGQLSRIFAVGILRLPVGPPRTPLLAYRRLTILNRYGDTAFFVLDTSSYRSGPDIPDYERTLLGSKQTTDLYAWAGKV